MQTAGLTVEVNNGWLTGVCISPSPNYNQRPDGAEISLVVVHNISLPPGEFGTGCVSQFFCNQLDHSAHPYFEEIRGLEVSAHCFIDRHGAIEQFVSFNDRAWHAGRSSFEGEIECNDYSIGIELEGTDTQAYTSEQYQSLANLIHVLMVEFPSISNSRVTGHSDIAPGRKTDPGPAFDWERLKAGLPNI